MTCNYTWDVVSHLNAMGLSESFPHKLQISIMNAGQHFWIHKCVMEASFPGTSIKVSLFCLHSPLPPVSPTAVTLSQAVLFSTAVPQRKCLEGKYCIPMQTSEEVTCSLSSSPTQMLCCTAEQLKFAFQKPLERKGFTCWLQAPAAVDASENVTKLSLNCHNSYL